MAGNHIGAQILNLVVQALDFVVQQPDLAVRGQHRHHQKGCKRVLLEECVCGFHCLSPWV
ncbi:MAG: hypothetical protein F4X78_03450 [Gammaproteobacteria bacterium]|nr:hypothetical protein [Gammaproteobacteria bacterium]